ncbi:unnamed protein product [Tilletia controversa]|nr:unnamed protein product [Tilletia controversa]
MASASTAIEINDDGDLAPAPPSAATNDGNEAVTGGSSSSSAATKRKRRTNQSDVWEYINQEKRVGDKLPCKKCGKLLASKVDSSSGTRHLWAHATFCFGLDQERGQQLLVFARAFGKDETRLASEALYDWIANDQQAFLATEHPAFLRFVKTLRQEYESPSADTVRRHLMAKYDESKAKLAIKHGLADAKTSDILEPLRKFSNTVRRSIPLSQKLKEMCARTGDTYSRPKRDMDVRWNSTYTMLQGLLSMETAIARLFRDDSDLQDVAFSSITWSCMRDIVAILAPFAQATEFLQGLKFSTLGTIAQTASLTAWGKSLALHLGAHLQHYCVHLIDGTATQFATILHPAVKMSLVGQSRDHVALRQEFHTYLSAHYSPAATGDGSSLPPAGDPTFLDLLQEHQGMRTAAGLGLDQQVESYLTDALVPKVPLPTDFWKEKAQRYPALAKMARDLLAIPASTAPSESMFSRGELLISARRNSLSSSTVARMMCLDNWLTQFGSSFAA